MSVTVYSHLSALRALRSSRTWRGEVPWRPCTSDEQEHVLVRSDCRSSATDLEELRSLGIAADADPESGAPREPLDILVGNAGSRVPRIGVRPHLISRLPPDGSLLRVSQGVYVCRPELCLIQLAATIKREELVAIAFELLGLYTLPPDGDGDFNPCEPAMTLDSLKDYLDRAGRLQGSRTVREALPYLLGRSRSPRETATVALLTQPIVRGGYGLDLPLLNHTVQLDSYAREQGGPPEYECDAYFIKARVDLEYDSAHHNDEEQRRRDTARDVAFARMGILVLRVSAAQLNDPGRLEPVARIIARRSGGRLRIRSSVFALRQALLHSALIKQQDAEDEPASDSDSDEETPEQGGQFQHKL